MTADVAYCFEDQEVEEAGRIMKGNLIRRLPVLNQDFGTGRSFLKVVEGSSSSFSIGLPTNRCPTAER